MARSARERCTKPKFPLVRRKACILADEEIVKAENAIVQRAHTRLKAPCAALGAGKPSYTAWDFCVHGNSFISAALGAAERPRAIFILIVDEALCRAGHALSRLVGSAVVSV